MLKSKLGPGLVVKDVDMLNTFIEDAISDVGTDYGLVLECVSAKILSSNDCSPALKANAIRNGSWYRKKIFDEIELRK